MEIADMSMQEQIDSFHRFASERIRAGSQLTMDELYDLWRLEHATPTELDENVRAVQAALDDWKNGDRGVPLEDAIREIREKYNLPASSRTKTPDPFSGARNNEPHNRAAVGLFCWL